MLSKKEIREKMLCTRKGCSGFEIREKSRQVVEHVKQLDWYKTSKVIMCYADVCNEVMTEELIKYSLAKGKRICLPFVVNCMKMEAREIKDYKSDTINGFCNIIEPVAEKTSIIEPERIDFVIIPGLAFDRIGNRVGYGKGYFDSFLSKLPDTSKKAGIAFRYQLVDTICAEEHDVKVDAVITEDGPLIIWG